MPIPDKIDDILHNRLLAALPQQEFQKIRPSLEPIDLEVDQSIWEVGDEREFICFPTTAMICLMHEAEDGTSSEVGMIGRQGVVGVAIFMDDNKTLNRAVVQKAGRAYRMSSEKVKKEFSECGDFQDLLLCYTQSLIAQLSQTAICNRIHSIEQQICRWLLVNYDHQGSKTFRMTHEQIANVLGVRRESVSLAASKLQEAGVINYSRGKIELVNKKKTEAAACECYGVVKEQYDKMLAKFIADHHS